MNAPVVELREVSKSFGGLAALSAVSLEVRRHEVVGLVGENGAGKSTLLKILSGELRPDSGEIRFSGEVVAPSGPRAAAALGVSIVHQEQALVPNLRVAENVLLGSEGDAVRAGWVRRRRLESRAAGLLAGVGSTADPRTSTADLGFAERQMVEIARATEIGDHGHPPLIILDEPTSVLESEDVDLLHDRVRALSERGSVIFVSHRLEEIRRFCDRIYVLRGGRVVAERGPDAGDDELYRLLVGREVTGPRADRAAVDRSAEPVLRVRDLAVAGRVHDVSFEIRPGEVLGLVGVAGSGREEIARAVFGAEPASAGAMHLAGRRYAPAGPAQAVRAGVAHVPAERRTDGMIAGLTVAETLLTVHPRAAAARGVLSARRRTEIARSWIDRLDVRPPDPHAEVGRLSGGNQQKVAVARWLQNGPPRLLLLDHPARGLDVGARDDLYRLFRELTAQGTAILLLADTLDEAIAASHRILALREGRITGEFDAGDAPTPLQLLEKMM